MGSTSSPLPPQESTKPYSEAAVQLPTGSASAAISLPHVTVADNPLNSVTDLPISDLLID